MRVLISGGGIAGPALAFWLHRGGADVTVVERAPGPRPGGHAVDIRGAARDVVEWMGLMPAIRADQVDERGAAMIDARGRRRVEMPAEMFGGEGMVAEIEIARGDLARILYEATDCAYRFADKIETLTQDADGVDVTFASGHQDRYDIVVGADGVHSGVRALAFGPEASFVRPLGGYTAYFTVPDPGDLDHWLLMYNAPGGRVAALRPERGGTAKAMLSFLDPAARSSHERLSRPAQEQIITERMAGAGWKVAELLAAMPGADDFYFDSVSQVHVDRWARGRVVLIGDAGYCGSPLAGLGTSMSLVGAYVLATELAGHDEPGPAFAAYQERMADYVASGMELPPGGIKVFAPRTRLMIRLRPLWMKMMFVWPMKAILAKQFSKADKIKLASPSSPRPAPERPAAAGPARRAR